MGITSEEIVRIAEQIKLELTENEIKEFAEHLQVMLQYTEKIRSAGTEEVSPAAYLSSEKNVFREDKPRPCLPREAALAHAPEVEDGMFRVPSVIE